jgi:hypothetical protein
MPAILSSAASNHMAYLHDGLIVSVNQVTVRLKHAKNCNNIYKLQCKRQVMMAHLHDGLVVSVD